MIRRKIKLGFFFISILLFLSGIISIWELNRLNRSTSELILSSKGNIELSKQLLDAVQQQNTLLLLSITDTTKYYENDIDKTREQFRTTLNEIEEVFADSPTAMTSIAKIEDAARSYNNLLLGATEEEMDTKWFVEVYNTSYNILTVSIKDFMISSENTLISSAKNVGDGAVRASMIGVIALSAGLLLVVLFYFLLNGFFLTPILKIDHSLKRYVEHGIPFRPEIQSNDEIKSLENSISNLIDKYKQR